MSNSTYMWKGLLITCDEYCIQLDQQIKKMPEDDEYGGFRKVQSVAFGEEATAGQMQGMDKSEQIRKIADKLAEPNELTCSSGDHISAQENNEQLAQDHKTSAASFFEVGCTRQGIASTAGNLSSDPTVSNPKTGSDGVRQCSTDIDSERPQKRHKNIEYTKKS